MFVCLELSNQKTTLTTHTHEGTMLTNNIANAATQKLILQGSCYLCKFIKKTGYKCNLLSYFDVWAHLLPPDFWFLLNIHAKFHERDKLYETTYNNFSENCTFEDPILFFHATTETVFFLITRQFPSLFEISLPKPFLPGKLLAII